jgi:uncharacterized iron-regulated membrane protein
MTTTNYWKPILATALPRTGLSIAPAMAILALACLIAALEPEAAGQVRNEIRIDAADIYANPPVGQTLEIVVKFKDDAKVKDILDTFWKDAQAARAKFDVFKKGQPEMA